MPCFVEHHSDARYCWEMSENPQAALAARKVTELR